MQEFNFNSRITQVELLGKQAKNIRELKEHIEKVPSNSIYHHTHHYLEQHCYFSPEHPNDFSYWIGNSLGLHKLAEQIASVDIIRFAHLDELRKAFVDILDHFLVGIPRPRACIEGEEFRFMASKIFILPTQFKASNLKEFYEAIKNVTVHSLYYHMFEARLRSKKTDNDFSYWLKTCGYNDLACQVSRLDPYTYTYEGLRKKLIKIIEQGIK